MPPRSAAPPPAWAVSPATAAAAAGVDPVAGLSAGEAAARRAQVGPNELAQDPPTPMWRLVLAQFDDMLVKVLLAAAAISFALALIDGTAAEEGMAAFVEPGVILLILALNAVVGVWQESNAEAALEALKAMQPASATVVRGGKAARIPAADLVPGDVIALAAGDAVPADARVLALTTATLRVEEASLTGESVAVHKDAGAVDVGVPSKGRGAAAHGPAHAYAAVPIHAKTCMLFASTAVVSGACTALVTGTGMATEIGAIQAQIAAAAAEEEGTPLKQKLDAFGEALARVIAAVCVAVWAINYRHFIGWETRDGSAWVPDASSFTFNAGACIYYFKVAVALAVAAIPEGLPAVITTCLALGTRRMARRNAIVRRLPSVETLGCTTVICSDKTGTLTTNQMSALEVVTVASVSAARGRGGGPAGAKGGGAGGLAPLVRAVSGTAFDPAAGSVAGLAAGQPLPPPLAAAAAVCALCNDARLERGGAGHAVKAAGAPTEAALLTLAEKLVAAAGGPPGAPPKSGLPRLDAALVAATGAPAGGGGGLTRLATLEFDRERKSMSVVVGRTTTTKGSTKGGGGSGAGGVGASLAAALPGDAAAPVLLVKGAAECVLARCGHALAEGGETLPLDAAARAVLAASVDAMASRALRVLALAVRPGPLPPPLPASGAGPAAAAAARGALGRHEAYEGIESGLTFIALVGLQDPPRPEVAAAVAECRAAGMRLVVITGDNRLTAEAVCCQIGVFPPGAPPPPGTSLAGADFVALSPAAQAALLGGGGGDPASPSRPPPGLCFSRAEPGQKQAIVRALRARGDVVAMTGDGVNDAPALKLADIGIAMGIAGTEVAKSAADMVLADDNFATIVAAVGEGRAIYANMCAFIRYMISSNVGEVAAIFLAAACGLPEGLAPVQLLWVNLVTDGPPATALGFNRADPDIMTKPPRPADDDLITPWLLARWLAVGAYVGAATVGIFAAWYVSPPWLASLGLDPAADGHTPVSWHQLRHWSTCGEWAKADGFAPAPFRLAGGGIVGPFASPCDVFGAAGKAKASTLSLSVLVAIEMFNALNALSEDCSLLSVPPWANPWLLAAMGVSFGLHALILYVPPLARMFAVVPLSRPEVALVLAFAAPVILIDECLKGVGRWRWRQSRAAAKAEAEALASPPASPARGRGRAGAGAAGGARRRVKAVA